MSTINVYQTGCWSLYNYADTVLELAHPGDKPPTHRLLPLVVHHRLELLMYLRQMALRSFYAHGIVGEIRTELHFHAALLSPGLGQPQLSATLKSLGLGALRKHYILFPSCLTSTRWRGGRRQVKHVYFRFGTGGLLRAHP